MRKIKTIVIAVLFAVLVAPLTSISKADTSLEDRINKLEKEMEELKKEDNKGSDLRVQWKDGLVFNTGDKDFEVKIGGRLQNDWAWFSQDSKNESEFEKIEDGTEFRRARLYMSGKLYGWIKFKAQYDFAGGEVALKDAYIDFTKIPVLGAIKTGHFKEPFSLEEQTSSKHITFMERGLPNVFSPGRNSGFMVHSNAFDERLTWAGGIFREVDDQGKGEGDGKYNYTVRITGLPLANEKLDKFLHIGAAYSHKNPLEDSLRYRQKPEAHLTPRFVDTDHFDANGVHIIGAELAGVFGPASIQGEYITAMVDLKDNSNANDAGFYGYYVQASYIFTGEHRKYKKSAGAFDKIKPKNNFSIKERGLGAWELAARFSSLDLTDKDADIDGGEIQDVSVGLNWYLNPNIRITSNYVHSEVEHSQIDNGDSDFGQADIYQMRFQIAF